MPVEFGVLGPIAAWSRDAAAGERPGEARSRAGGDDGRSRADGDEARSRADGDEGRSRADGDEARSRVGGDDGRSRADGDDARSRASGGEARSGADGDETRGRGAGDDGRLALKGPKQRAVLARLILARGEVVSVDRLVDDLWLDPPARAAGAIRTFVRDLRQALEPDRAPRAPARILVTEGNGYVLDTPGPTVDAWRFEHAVTTAATLPADRALGHLTSALGEWRGPAYGELADEHWTRAERTRLTELRLHAVEQRAQAWLALGRTAEAAAELDAHVAEHPWREDAWRLLAVALYRGGRQGDALAVLRRARTLLIDQLGVDPGPDLRRLEQDILRHEDGLATSVERVWADTAAAYDRTVATGAKARLESTVGLLRELAVTGGGGLEAARTQRMAAIAAAEELGDPELTARVIGAYDVPAIWTRSDDPAQAARIVAAAERTLPHVTHEPARARLLTTIALESRGTTDRRREAAEAERIARRLDDPTLLAFALNGVFMQSCHVTGNAPRRDALGQELVELSRRHGLVTFEILGHLIRIQACSALADFATADAHAEAADALKDRNERPLTGVFTQWYRALKLAATGGDAEAAYRAAAASLDGAGMPGLDDGLLGLALLSLDIGSDAGLGPYAPWARPFPTIDPPPDLLQEALWCLVVDVAIAANDALTMRRAHERLAPAANELAAGSGLVSFGSVQDRLDALAERGGENRVG